MSIIDDKSKGCRKWIKDPVHLNEIEDAYHAGTENILNELASRIEKAEIVNVRQVLEWIEEQTKE